MKKEYKAIVRNIRENTHVDDGHSDAFVGSMSEYIGKEITITPIDKRVHWQNWFVGICGNKPYNFHRTWLENPK